MRQYTCYWNAHCNVRICDRLFGVEKGCGRMPLKFWQIWLFVVVWSEPTGVFWVRNDAVWHSYYSIADLSASPPSSYPQISPFSA